MGIFSSILSIIQGDDSSAEKIEALNAADDAMACAALFGFNELATLALTWAYFGGTWPVIGAPAQVASGTLTLAASTTNYIEADLMAASASAVVLVNQSGFTPGRVPLYTVVTGSSAIATNGVTDVRPWVLPVGTPFAGYKSISTTGGSTTLSQLQAAALLLKFTGTLTSNATMVFPLVPGAWFVNNATTGSYTLSCGGATGSPVEIGSGYSLIYCDGTNFGAIIGNSLSPTGVTPGTYTSANITVTADGRITSASNGSGGGGSIYTVPESADFTIANQPTGATISDTDTGMVLTTPEIDYSLFLLWDNTAITPSETFSLTVGFKLNKLYAGLGAMAICIGDGTGKITMQQIYDSSGARTLQIGDKANSATSYNGDGTAVGILYDTCFLRVEYDLTNFNVSVGTDLNNMMAAGSMNATTFTGTPTQIGININGYTAAAAMTVFHYLRGS